MTPPHSVVFSNMDSSEAPELLEYRRGLDVAEEEKCEQYFRTRANQHEVLPRPHFKNRLLRRSRCFAIKPIPA